MNHLGSKLMRVNNFWRKRSTKSVSGTTWVSIGDYLLERGIEDVNKHWELFIKIWNYCNNSKDTKNCVCVIFRGHDGPIYNFAVNRNFDFLRVLENDIAPVGEKIRREFFVDIGNVPVPIIYERIENAEIISHRIIAFGHDSGYSDSLDVSINRVVDLLFPDPAERIEIRRLLREALTSHSILNEQPI